ncbi:MAG: adenosylcobinamide-GDP ribazoletransferase [Hyphomicrobiaceae bacterium]|nr:adenosylcobinamide-GDP ribazoletransferase [Hyphomicrobiaceae bacterium]
MLPLLRARLNDVILAVTLLTRLPMPPATRGDNDALAAAIWVYPLVGAMVGALGGAAFLIARHLGLPADVASWLAIATMVLTTGCFHEDGLADFWDGIGGGHTVERKLEIMRDSRIGSYGGAAMIMMFGIRAAMIAALARASGDASAALALVAAGLLGRSAITVVLTTTKAARLDGLAVAAQAPPAKASAAALAMSLLIFAIVPMQAGVAAIAASVLVALVMADLMRRQIGGYTGDALGATEIKVELAALAAILAYAS